MCLVCVLDAGTLEAYPIMWAFFPKQYSWLVGTLVFIQRIISVFVLTLLICGNHVGWCLLSIVLVGGCHWHFATVHLSMLVIQVHSTLKSKTLLQVRLP